MNGWNIFSFIIGAFTTWVWLGRPVDSRDANEEDGMDFSDEEDTWEYER